MQIFKTVNIPLQIYSISSCMIYADYIRSYFSAYTVFEKAKPPCFKKYIASEGKMVYNVLNMIIMGVVPTEEKFR